jgi:hypothetical protein
MPCGGAEFLCSAKIAHAQFDGNSRGLHRCWTPIFPAVGRSGRRFPARP